MVALVDIDGTIADCGHRLHHIEARPDFKKDWNAFYDAMVADKPIIGMCNLIRVLNDSYKIVYITGRPDSHRRQTSEWLDKFYLPRYDLVMRKAGDHRADYVVKEELFKKSVLPVYGFPSIAIEDRKQVVDMWRSLGILTLQPCEGNY